MKCSLCRRTSSTLGHKAPKGWLPFAWGSSTEDPQHFYVFPESTPEPKAGIPQELLVSRLCEVSSPECR